MTRMLDLNESQQDKLREILEQQRPQREALHEKMSANREALRQLLESGTADANAVGELVLEGRRLHDEGRTLHEAEQKSIRAILTRISRRSSTRWGSACASADPRALGRAASWADRVEWAEGRTGLRQAALAPAAEPALAASCSRRSPRPAESAARARIGRFSTNRVRAFRST